MQASSTLILDTVRILLVATHIVAVAVAIGLVFWQDIALVTSRRINALQFQLSSTQVTRALLVLWLTGIAIIGLDTGLDLAVIAAKPKILAKVTVVVLLSINGWVLHRFAFPALLGTHKNPRRTAALVTTLGAVSTVSWLYAIFLGVARPLAQVLSYTGFVGIYATLLAVGIAMALYFTRPHIEMLLSQPTGFTAQQVMAILFGLGRIAPEGSLSRHASLERHVGHVADGARHYGTLRRSKPPVVETGVATGAETAVETDWAVVVASASGESPKPPRVETH